MGHVEGQAEEVAFGEEVGASVQVRDYVVRGLGGEEGEEGGGVVVGGGGGGGGRGGLLGWWWWFWWRWLGSWRVCFGVGGLWGKVIGVEGVFRGVGAGGVGCG